MFKFRKKYINENNKKKLNNFSLNVNQITTLQQFKKKNFIIDKEVNNVIKEIDEENYDEDDDENNINKIGLNKKKKKKLFDKSEKIDIKPHYENPDYNGFYQDPIKFKLYESIQLHDLMTRKNDDIFNQSSDEEYNEQENVIKNNIDNLESFDSNKEDDKEDDKE